MLAAIAASMVQADPEPGYGYRRGYHARYPSAYPRGRFYGKYNYGKYHHSHAAKPYSYKLLKTPQHIHPVHPVHPVPSVHALPVEPEIPAVPLEPVPVEPVVQPVEPVVQFQPQFAFEKQPMLEDSPVILPAVPAVPATGPAPALDIRQETFPIGEIVLGEQMQILDASILAQDPVMVVEEQPAGSNFILPNALPAFPAVPVA